MLVAIALETTEQTYKSPLSFHWPPHWGNFSEAWNTGGQAGLGPGLRSSLIITLSSVVALIVLGSLCAYTIARRRGRLSNLVYIGVRASGSSCRSSSRSSRSSSRCATSASSATTSG